MSARPPQNNNHAAAPRADGWRSIDAITGKAWFWFALVVILCAAPYAAYQAVQLSGGGNVTIRYWNGFTGPDGRTMLRLVRRFERENPGISVVMQRIDWATYYNKLFVAGIGDRAPDLFVLHADMTPRFQQAGFMKTMDHMFSPEWGMSLADFDDNVTRYQKVGGCYYGIPLDIHMFGLYYNKKLFREAGIVDKRGEARPPQTSGEFLDAARRLTKPPRWGFVFTWMRNVAYTMMLQWGGAFFENDGAKCVMNNPENVTAMSFCRDLIAKYKVAPSPENFDAWIGFRQGKVGMVLEGVWMLADLKKQTDLEYGGAPVPQFGPRQADFTSAHVLCMRKGLDGRKLDAVSRLVKFLSDNSLDWAEGGQVPARRSLRETPRFRAMEPQWQFSRQIPYVSFHPFTPMFGEYTSELDYMAERVLRGTATPEEALKTAQDKINEALERRRQMLERGGKL
ncbi:MAG: ABC transporter substrate-binding protein [bacterium]|nr:ABC transporter substrate-binding protein [Candidatus Sumerlaeota bacterium]